MAQTYLPSRRGALYCITQAADGTYLAPTQASDKALACMDFSLSWEGGVQRVEDDLTPYGGGSLPYMADIAATFKIKLRLPAWPGSQNAADLPAWAALLAAMPLTGDYSGSGTAVFTPTTTQTIGAAGNIKPASLTFLETGGDVWTLQDCVAIIDQITDENGALVVEVSGLGLLRSLALTVRTLAAASLTIADVAYTSVSPLPSRGAALTLTGLSGSGTYALRPGFAFAPGMKLEPQADRLSAFGFAVAAVSSPMNAALSCKVTKLDESGAAWPDAYLQQTALSACVLTWGSGASSFRFSLGTAVRVAECTPSEDAGVRTLDLGIVGTPTSSGNDQYSIQWGA